MWFIKECDDCDYVLRNWSSCRETELFKSEAGKSRWSETFSTPINSRIKLAILWKSKSLLWASPFTSEGNRLRDSEIEEKFLDAEMVHYTFGFSVLKFTFLSTHFCDILNSVFEIPFKNLSVPVSQNTKLMNYNIFFKESLYCASSPNMLILFLKYSILALFLQYWPPYWHI